MEIPLAVTENSGRGVYGIAAAIALRIPGIWIFVRIAYHGTAELPDTHVRVGNNFAAVRAYCTLAVDVPAVAVGIIVPEIELDPGAEVARIGIIQRWDLRRCLYRRELRLSLLSHCLSCLREPETV